MSASTSHAVSEEVERLRGALDVAQQSLDAILSGKVDALVVKGNGGEQVFSLLGADQPYRILLEGMSEGALTLDREGLVLFCNRCFAKMVGLPLKRVIGNKVCRWLDADNQAAFAALLASTDP
ncbi:MAG: PAS domain-containing protein, partial [Betaproteobacteria bacterium]|nr:PAS domain-containing protein [Betaproteobacteria bacterium]